VSAKAWPHSSFIAVPDLAQCSRAPGVPVLPTLPPKVRNQNTPQQSWEADRKMWGAYAKMDWFKNQELEPIMPHNSTSILAQWLNEVDEGKVWECRVPSDTAKTWCDHKPLKRFDRALAHVRTHLGLKPFPCEGRCETDGWYVMASYNYLIY